MNLTDKEHELIKTVAQEAAKAAVAASDERCHFQIDERKKLHSLTDNNRTARLLEMADAAEAVDISQAGHSFIFMCGKQVVFVGEKAVRWMIMAVLALTVSVFLLVCCRGALPAILKTLTRG